MMMDMMVKMMMYAECRRHQAARAKVQGIVTQF